MSETYAVKKQEEFKTSLWSGGSTTELYIYPEDAIYKEGNFQCRISSATVEVERSDFTSLPGVKRYLSIFHGHLDMIHGEGEKVSLEPFQVDCFDGGVPTVSFGQVVDFNLMLKNGADGKMEAAQISAGESFILEPKEGQNLLVVYAPVGKVKIDDMQIETGELFICKNWSKELRIENTGESVAGLGICRVSVK
nr:HutD family protein [uncultured Blautia sp.]